MKKIILYVYWKEVTKEWFSQFITAGLPVVPFDFGKKVIKIKDLIVVANDVSFYEHSQRAIIFVDLNCAPVDEKEHIVNEFKQSVYAPSQEKWAFSGDLYDFIFYPYADIIIADKYTVQGPIMKMIHPYEEDTEIQDIISNGA
ncbi:MAG: hypothetical protein KatS3mg083_293 [Candidatus Dojkabacteria bacterium]|nr:MAG: hypothetical protein KatS3mg083_293 [Candidatus Dojkabacteria bacterium]